MLKPRVRCLQDAESWLQRSSIWQGQGAAAGGQRLADICVRTNCTGAAKIHNSHMWLNRETWSLPASSAADSVESHVRCAAPQAVRDAAPRLCLAGVCFCVRGTCICRWCHWRSRANEYTRCANILCTRSVQLLCWLTRVQFVTCPGIADCFKSKSRVHSIQHFKRATHLHVSATSINDTHFVIHRIPRESCSHHRAQRQALGQKKFPVCRARLLNCSCPPGSAYAKATLSQKR